MARGDQHENEATGEREESEENTTMDMYIFLYVREGTKKYNVGCMLCPVVPHIGETVYLNMSTRNPNWWLNPENPFSTNSASFKVEDVVYEGYNIRVIEPGMGAAPDEATSVSFFVQLYVHALDKDTRVYVDRVIEQQAPEEQ